MSNKINDYILVDNSRNISYDYMYAIEKIVDISLRAISPGINDPNTAIQCINILGILLSMMSKESSNACRMSLDEENIEIIYQYFDFKNDIYKTFYQIVIYGGQDISVVMAIIKALKNISYNAEEENIELLNEIKDYVYENTLGNFKNEMDKEKIKELMQ